MKKFFSNIKSWLNKKFVPVDILDEDSKIGFDIFNTALNDENCIRILNTELSGKKYIVPKSYYTSNDTTSCVILNTYLNKLTVVNHVHKYDIFIPHNTCAIMDKMFNDKVQNERDDLEQEILKNSIKSLSTVLENFKSSKNGKIGQNVKV